MNDISTTQQEARVTDIIDGLVIVDIGETQHKLNIAQVRRLAQSLNRTLYHHGKGDVDEVMKILADKKFPFTQPNK